MGVLQKVLIALSFAVLVKGHVVHWDYENQKHHFWEEHYPHCALKSQSPIDVNTTMTSYKNDLSPFSLDLFTSTREDIEIVNNGHNIQVNLHDAWTIPRGMGGLSDNFKVAQFHFHWAEKNTSGGSEHTVNGRHSWGEMHVVHYNDKYKNIGKAVDKSDGLAVLGFLIEDNADRDHEGFARLSDWIRNGQYSGDKSHLSYFRLSEILKGENLADYYRYKGSLTTPPCYESVSWTLFKDPIRISKNQASFFQDNLYQGARGRSTKHESGNFRPTQPLNGRNVYRSWTGEWAHGLFDKLAALVIKNMHVKL